ncbi:MAG TPA: pilus assembly protein PilM [Candidatus Brocadiia bacterium]|nr:pilus assembly protein PilM [Candidatus Brocadiia bacterium]
MLGAKRVWGIEIGSHAIKAVQILASDSGLEITDFDILPHKGTPEPFEGPVTDRRAWRTLALFQERRRLGADHVVISVPGSCVFTRPFQVIEVEGKPLQELIRYEAQQHIGLDLDAVLWDSELFLPDTENSHNRDGILFAMKKAEYNLFVRGLDASRLQVDDVQSLPMALCNYARYGLDITVPTAVVDIGAATTNVVVIYGGRYWVRSLGVGGRLITAELEKSLNCDFASAEAIKLNAPRSQHAREVLQRMLPALRALSAEVQNALQLFHNDAPDVKLQHAILLGGASRSLGLTTLLGQETGLAVQTPNLLERFPPAPGVDAAALREAAPALAPALGLALQGAGRAPSHISLVSSGTVRGKRLARTQPFALASLAVAALFVVLSIVFTHAQAARVSDACDRLDSQIAPINDRYRRWQAVQKPTPAEIRLRAFDAVGAHRDAFFRVLSSASRIFARAPGKRRLWLRSIHIEMPRGEGKEQRYQNATVLKVRIEGATERKRRETETQARDEVSSIVRNILHGLPEIPDPKPDVTTNASTNPDTLSVAVGDTWNALLFSVDFKFLLQQPGEAKP